MNSVQAGKLNCVGDVTLTANAATTTVNSGAALLCAPDSHVSLSPTTANAKAEHASATGAYVSSRSDGSFVITHNNNAQADRTFTYAVIG